MCLEREAKKRGLGRGLSDKRGVKWVGNRKSPLYGGKTKVGEELPGPDSRFHFSRVCKPSGAPAALLYRGCPAPGLRWKQGKLDLCVCWVPS